MKGLDQDYVLSTSNSFKQGCQANSTTDIPDESELCHESQGRNRQFTTCQIHGTSQKGYLIKPNRRSTQEKWQNLSMCRLLQTKFGNHN